VSHFVRMNKSEPRSSGRSRATRKPRKRRVRSRYSKSCAIVAVGRNSRSGLVGNAMKSYRP
jgi:hypothetical protein